MLIAKNKPTTDEEYHRTKERDYWKRQLYLTKCLTWITGVGVVGGVVSLWLLKGTLDVTWEAADAAKRSTDVAYQTMILSERPWISAMHEIRLPLERNRDGVHITLEEVLRNVGKGVAMDVRWWMDMVPVDLTLGYAKVLNQQKQQCEADRDPSPGLDLGYVFFPRQKRSQERTVTVTVEEIHEVTPSDDVAMAIVLSNRSYRMCLLQSIL